MTSQCCLPRIKVSWFLGGLAWGIGLRALNHYIYNEYGEDIREGICIPHDLQDPLLKQDRELRTVRIMERKIKAFKLQDRHYRERPRLNLKTYN